MATVSFTHRIDADLKAELDRIAENDNRTASYVANQAIERLVEERKATRELVDLGLQLVEMKAPSVSSEDFHAWLLSDEEEFPQGRVVS